MIIMDTETQNITYTFDEGSVTEEVFSEVESLLSEVVINREYVRLGTILNSAHLVLIIKFMSIIGILSTWLIGLFVYNAKSIHLVMFSLCLLLVFFGAHYCYSLCVSSANSTIKQVNYVTMGVILNDYNISWLLNHPDSTLYKRLEECINIEYEF